MIEPRFSINTVVDDRGRTVRIHAGEWRAAHRAGCAEYLSNHSMRIDRKREIVVVSCGGYPYDINLIQAHKALDMAAHACVDGGTIILLAECPDGLGQPTFMKWFEEKDSRALEARLLKDYEVNGQTAWSLLAKAERYRIHLISKLEDDEVRRMRMIPARSLTEVPGIGDGKTEGYIMPRGAAILPLLEST